MQTRFKFKEGLMTALGIKNQMVKMSLMLVSGALLWSSGGVQEVKAQVCGDGGQYAPDNINGVVTPVCIGGSAGNRIYGTHPYDGYGPPPPANNTAPPPVIQKPSSYGAVAWGENALGTSANQTTKQGAVDAALQKCGDSTCKIVAQYSNQCVASTSGLKKNGKYVWQSSFGMTQKKAEQAALRDCSKHAKNCKVFLSECSLP